MIEKINCAILPHYILGGMVKYNINRYGDLTIENELELNNLEKLKTFVKKSNKETIWLEVLEKNSNIIPEILKLGFTFHHAENKSLSLVLNRKKEMFHYASHYVGVGAVVIHENKLLTVVENFHKDYKQGSHKLPGGFLNKDEHIKDAAIREVFEETGIKTEFEHLFTLRHNHQSRYFNKSSIYFVVKLEAKSFDIKIDDKEIKSAKWMDINEFLNDERVYPFNKQVVESVLKGDNKLKNIESNCKYDKDLYEIYI